jgi:glycogen phosphorylase
MSSKRESVVVTSERATRAPTTKRVGAKDGLAERLRALASNLWWTWNPDVVNIFRDLDPVRWRELDHNPVVLLNELTAESIDARARELALHSRIHQAHRRLQEYLRHHATWGDVHAGVLLSRPVVYFSAEFGLHESMPIYSGGLGVLAGDHVKSASDLGVPLIGIGLLYSQGYFVQRLDRAGWQQEDYVEVGVDRLPLTLARNADGQPLSVEIETRSGTLAARVWRLAAGRIVLLLLDPDCEGNPPEQRKLMARLYGGDAGTRIRQELLLGVGGVRALHALGVTPGVLHLNEGHSAFATLELVRLQMESNAVEFGEAARTVAEMTCFTTHTPVAAGHDRFPAELVEEHLGPLRKACGLSRDHLLALGRVDQQNPSEEFCMTVLALKLSRYANGVSALHGGVSRRMWNDLWPERAAHEVPIGHVTNGVHVHSWLAPQMRALYDRHMGAGWAERSGQPEVWAGADAINDGELWETHQVLKARLLDFVRRRTVRQLTRNDEPEDKIEAARHALDLETLTIGFARRFATYKRATLLLQQLERLLPLLRHTFTPIQLIFAGKAHPRDDEGKRLLREIAELTRSPGFAGRMVFIEDYDINVGRHLVEGVDLWLNNPRRPLEASGTSGQKVVLNGGLNLSVLDGWWAEAYDGLNGFAIGDGSTHADPSVQDNRDAENLYGALEGQVVPLYYQRDTDGLPRAWIARMKRAIRTLGWRFNADRMVMDYVRNSYLPAAGGISCRMP